VGIVSLLVASPALSRLLVWPRTEFFTELWILGKNHMAEYPYNISNHTGYSVFLGIGNQLGYCAYYSVEVKFRNQTQSAPSSFGPIENRTPSSLPSLFNISAFVADQGTWELPLTFSFDWYNETSSKINFQSLMLNGVSCDLSGYESAWNASKSEFYGNLFFETWIYERTIDNFQYHSRFVSLRLNMSV
jgi:hypothetical protein